MTTITRERVAEIIHAAGLEPCDYEEVFGSIKTGEIVAMARIALASLEAEPVAWIVHARTGDQLTADGGYVANAEGILGLHSTPLYTAPPAPDDLAKAFISAIEKEQDRLFGEDYLMDSKDCIDVIREEMERLNACRAAMLQGKAEHVSNRDELPEEKGASLQLRNLIRQRHAEWSDATFGNVGPVGPLKHLSKEALEAAAEPDDLSEWADMQLLLWDAQRRAGISDGEITAAMEEKLEINKARQWPEPKDGEPRQHIKEPPYPILPGDLIKGAAMIQGGK